ncbi:ABC transporter ATP-binding protein [Vibrio nitrifigilis]|uniref:ATP-binding cassette domain-containing protein n=1 Tax=Vibrio nitrifigilis TaxID=2789781 RepID=A0ABS0GML8_9VIBR|nr:ATP-binding cassette domain-containing protein [Vibrio nitrifigilis]MBF9003565.1 ATP-binding cassette domain-containing protein [Vibrio nitrifigilis]
MNADTPFLTLNNVSFTPNQQAIIQDLTLAFTQHERVGLVGASGSGKSTLLKLILGVNQPSLGQLACQGEPIRKRLWHSLNWYREQVQYIPQDPQNALPPMQSVAKVLAEPVKRLKKREVTLSELIHALKQVGLTEETLNKKAGELSGGQAQRVALARALMVKPVFLLADEPTSGLDLPLREQIKTLLLEVCQQNHMGLLLVTHDMSIVSGLCDRLLVMNHGAIVEDRPTQAVLTSPQHPYTQQLLEAVPSIELETSHFERRSA